MSEWRGLHNPERHEPHGGIADCIIETANPVMARWCTRDHPCRCCMDEEARVLRSALSGLGQRVFDAENTLANVRDWADRTGRYVPGQITDWQRGFLTARREVRQLLDGTDE